MDVERLLLERLQGAQARQAAAPVRRVAEDPTEEIETNERPDAPAPSAAAAPPDRGVTHANLFRHGDAHPYVLDLALLRRYGPEWMVWEPEIVARQIAEDYRGGISDVNMGKLQAVKTLHLVDFFWQQWEIFLPCAMALNGVVPDFGTLQPPTVAQCAVAVDIANQLRDDVEWAEEVKRFVGVVFEHDGIFVPREPLDFVHLDLEGLPIDREEILERWPGVRASRRAPQDETITAEQLRRMLLVEDYLEDYRSRLRHQQRLILHGS